MNREPHLDRIDFGHDDDKRVTLIGANLPFAFGKIERLQLMRGGEALTVVVSRDKLMESAVTENESFMSFLRRMFR